MKRLNSSARYVAALAMAAIGFALAPMASAQQFTSTPAVSVSSGATAMQTAAQEGKYLFVYFWKTNDRQTQLMQGVLQDTVGKMMDTAATVSIQITDPSHATIVKQFGVSRAPMPLVLAIAPNGAITKGLPVTFDAQQLRDAVVSTGTANCLKALQDQQLVLLCVKHEMDAHAFQGARALLQDARYSASSQMVTIDPADPSEQAFLRSLNVDPSANKGVTVVLTPPGQPVATFAESATKDEMVAKLTSLSSSCCPDGKCAPGQQCCPGGKCPPAAK